MCLQAEELRNQVATFKGFLLHYKPKSNLSRAFETVRSESYQLMPSFPIRGLGSDAIRKGRNETRVLLRRIITNLSRLLKKAGHREGIAARKILEFKPFRSFEDVANAEFTISRELYTYVSELGNQMASWSSSSNTVTS